MKRCLQLLTAGWILAALTIPAVAAEIKQDVGLRGWYANYYVDRAIDDNLGWAPMGALYYDLNIDQWKFGAMAGYGSGWGADSDTVVTRTYQGTTFEDLEHFSIDYKRLDLQVSAGRQLGPILVGLNYHYLAIQNDQKLEYQVWGDSYEYEGDLTYHGPEILVGSGLNLGDFGLSVYGTAIWSPYMFANDKEKDKTEDTSDTWSGHTMAFGFDLGLGYQKEMFQAALGYRFMKLNETTESEGSYLYAERFHGPYLEVGLAF